MTTRKRLYLYHLCGLVGFSGTLLAVAPPLAAVAVGFSAVYLTLLAVLYFLAWLVKLGRRPAWLRAAFMTVMAAGALVVFSGLGGIDAGLAAVLLSVLSFWPWWRLAR